MRSSIMSYKFKALLVFVIVISALLILVPFILTRFFDISGDKLSNNNETAPFETIKTPDTIAIYRTSSGKVETIDFEDYIKGVVASEMPSSFHEEALKAQSVAARSYATAKVIKAEEAGNPSEHPEAALCDTTHCQVYRSAKELKDLKGADWMDNDWQKICSAVDETAGELLYYDGKLVEQALFHSSSGGMTENSEDVFAAAVPYLVSVESPYEDEATHKNEKTALSISDLEEKLKKSYPSIDFGNVTSSDIKIISRSNGNRVEKIRIGSAYLTGRQVRESLGLSSANFEIDIDGDTITFTSNGSGHGVGMSQYGADGMAKEGYDYKKILSHYYSGTEIY